MIDFPKQGFGNSNDGNTARRFFKNPKLAAEITGVDENLINRFGLISKLLENGYNINYNAFTDYCYETAGLYVEKYTWYYMPPTVHNILIHGVNIAKNAIILIGQVIRRGRRSKK